MTNLDFSKFHILVIGDVMLDKYIFGTSDRISPEAPVPVVAVNRYDSRLGGAANVALNIVALGASVSLLGVLGDDEMAIEMATILKDNAINNICVNEKNRPTTVKTRVLAGTQHLLRIDHETTRALEDQTIDNVVECIKVESAQKKIDYVILQDYNKGFFNNHSISLIIQTLSQLGIPYAVDPKFDNAASFVGADIYKPNLKEARQLINSPMASNENIAKEIKKMLNCDTVVLTLSEEGLYCLNNEEEHKVPTRSQDIVDVCGAGDTVISALVLSRLSKKNLLDQAIFANIAAGIVCQKPGVVPVSIDEISKYFVQK